MGIRYTGTGYLSSAMAMDKRITKEVFLMNQVPTPGGFYHDQGPSGKGRCQTWLGVPGSRKKQAVAVPV